MRSNGGCCELRLNGQHGQWLRAGGKNKRFALWLRLQPEAVWEFQ